MTAAKRVKCDVTAGAARVVLALVALAAAAVWAVSCGTNKNCDDYCGVLSDRIHDCCLGLDPSWDWCLAGSDDQLDYVGQCSAFYALAISDAKVEERNLIRNECAAAQFDVPELECSELIEHYDDTWDALHSDDGTSDDDTAPTE